jgi:hypothetical protein
MNNPARWANFLWVNTSQIGAVYGLWIDFLDQHPVKALVELGSMTRWFRVTALRSSIYA